MNKLTRFALLAALLCSNIKGVLAADNDTLQFFDEEAQVILAAARHAQKTADAPANVYIVTQDDIERYGYRTLGDALQSSSGFYMRDDRSALNGGVRGLGRASDANFRVLLLINGHRINSNLTGAANYDRNLPVDMKAVQRIEVVKGPGSALYGDNAFLAVVNIITKTANTAKPIETSIETASYGTTREFLGVAKNFKNGLGFYMTGSHQYMRGQNIFYPEFAVADNSQGMPINNGIAVDANREEDYNIFASLSGPHWNLMASVNNFKERQGAGTNQTNFNDPGTYVNNAYNYVDFKTEKAVSDFVTLSARLYYDWEYYHGNFNEINFFTAPPPDSALIKDATRSYWYGEETTARFTPFGDSNALLIGQDLEITPEAHQWTYLENIGDLSLADDNRRLMRYAFFAQQEFRPADKLEFNLGARFDHYRTFGNTFNPRLAAIYHPWKDGSFKLLYGSAFRAPSPLELAFDSFGGLVQLPHVGPERIITYEADYEHDFLNRGIVTVGYFQSRTRDLIGFDVVPVPALGPGIGAVVFANTDRTRTDGGELSAKLDLGYGFSTHLNYTLQRTTTNGTGVFSRNGDRPENSPTQFGTLGLSKRLSGINNTTISGEVFYIGRNTTFLGTTDPATALLSVNIRTQPWRKGPIIFARVANILDTTYLLSSKPGEFHPADPQDGRTFVVGLDYRVP